MATTELDDDAKRDVRAEFGAAGLARGSAG
jgi:hypothetical protein